MNTIPVIYNENISRPSFWTGEKWVDADGFSSSKKKGTTANRPVNLEYFDDDGYSFFDTSLNKLIFLQTIVGSLYNTETVPAASDIHVSNTCTEGNYYKLTVLPSSTSVKQMIFRKGENIETDQIVVCDTSQISVNITFQAPNPSEYPYIYYKNGRPAGASNDFTFSSYNVVQKWKEQDGATAGVLRSGNTASRPVGGDIYVGFMYMDTEAGKPVYAKAISGDTVTWVDATGATV